MQCSSCDFHNIPGIVICGRCGANLAAKTLTIDVHPPRASGRRKFLRKQAHRFSGVLVFVTSALRTLLSVFRPINIGRVPTGNVAMRFVIPGWPQIHCGHGIRGRLLLFSYLGTLIPGLLFIGDPLASLLLGAALSIHAASVLDIVLTHDQNILERLGTWLLVTTTLLLGLYGPFYWLSTRVVGPMVVQVNAQPFARGDVLIVNRWAHPRVGDVVIYEMPYARINMGEAHRVYQVGGPRIERIVAGPGQVVEVRAGRILVDGQESPVRPLVPDQIPKEFRRTIGPGQWLIFPTTDYIASNGGFSALADLSLVAESAVTGKVLFRARPFGRFGSIRGLGEE
jgi:signal peptidase I